MDFAKIWKELQDTIKNSIGNDVGYTVHIKPSEAIAFKNSVLTIVVTTFISRNIINFRFKDKIEGVLEAHTGQKITLNVISQDEKEEFLKNLNVPDNEELVAPKKYKEDETNLNEKYTFENFVIGTSNEYAASAAISASEQPGRIYNPLFLYGNSGLGKTHLMCAIGNKIKKENPNLKIIYIQTESFTNEFVKCIRNYKMDYFRKKFRTADVLLVDDVQFLENREGFQEEFFHTFNELYDKGKQIVLTSDKKPGDLITLEERLRTRFSQGLQIDVAVPNYETRLAILKKKSDSNGYNIDDKILEYIADRIKSNVRELEGALIRVVSLSQLKNNGITLEMAKFAIDSILPKDGIVKITPDKIMEKVCIVYDITKEDMLGKKRTQNLVMPRQVAMYLCSKLTDMNTQNIANAFEKDRSTVKHSIEKIESDRGSDEKLRTSIDYIIKDLQSS